MNSPFAREKPLRKTERHTRYACGLHQSTPHPATVVAPYDAMMRYYQNETRPRGTNRRKNGR